MTFWQMEHIHQRMLICTITIYYLFTIDPLNYAANIKLILYAFYCKKNIYIKNICKDVYLFCYDILVNGTHLTNMCIDFYLPVGCHSNE